MNDDTLTSPSTKAQAREKLDRAASTAHETVDRVYEKANAMTERVTGETDRYYQSATQWITAHPMQALLGALFAGYLFGRMRH
jgi:hypothetical protein